MGTATVQLNTRIDPMLKAGGDAVLTRNGLGPSDAIRALWVYLVEHQALPGFMVADKREAPRAESLAERGCGLAFLRWGYVLRILRQLDHLRKTGMPYEMICMRR